MANKFIILLLLLLSASFADADDYSNFNSDGEDYSHFNDSRSDKFRDWNSVLRLLAAKGVNTGAIDWNPIESACYAVNNTASGTKYNECRYKSALRYSKYQKDKTYCNASAQQKYFKYIKPNGGTTINNNVKGNNYNNPNQKTSNKDAEKFRHSAYVICMNDSGWSDPDSWLTGFDEAERHHH